MLPDLGVPDPSILLSDARFFRFRALEDVELRLEPLTVLIGENNAGKSAVLRGLDVALGAPPQEDDFFIAVDGSRSADFQIDIRFIPWNGSEFPDSVSDVVGIQMLGLTGPVQHFAWRVNGSLSPSGAGVELARRYLTAWPAGPSDEGPSLSVRTSRLSRTSCLTCCETFRAISGPAEVSGAAC